MDDSRPAGSWPPGSQLGMNGGAVGDRNGAGAVRGAVEVPKGVEGYPAERFTLGR